MKKIIYSFVFAFAVLFVSCESLYDGRDFIIYDIEEPEGPELPEPPKVPEIGDKGIGIVQNGTWSSKVSNLRGFWHYSWGPNISPKEPDSCEFIPMIWGQWGINAERAERLKQWKDEGKIRYLLGFNEPDNVDQSNMTVEKAIELWPLLEQVGVPLGSPATVHADNDWMKNFMTQATSAGLRIDFVCVHWYGGNSPQGFLDHLEYIHDLYGKPIWITEFAIADWDATTPDENQYTLDDALYFMQEVLPELENRDYIQRYSWFPGDINGGPLSCSALWDGNGVFTKIGDFYANFEPNNSIGSGKDDYIYPGEEDNLITNGNFELGGNDGWSGSNNGIEMGNSNTGYYSGMLKNNVPSASLLQVLKVTPGTVFNVSFSAMWREEGGEMVMEFKNNDDNSSLYKTAGISSTSWQTVTDTFTVPPNVTNLKITFYKGEGKPVCLIDDVKVKIETEN